MDEEKDIKVGWAEAFAAALSGLMGQDFVGSLDARMENQKSRKERKAEREADRAERDEERKTNEDRYNTGLMRDIANELAPIFQAAGVSGQPKSPLTVTPGGGMVPSIGIDPNASAATVTGIPDDIRKELETLVPAGIPGGVERVAGMAQSRARANVAIERQQFETKLKEREEEITRLAPLESRLAIEHSIAQFNAMNGLEFEDYQRRAYLQHNLSLQLQAAARVPDAPKPKDQYEALVFSAAQELAGAEGVAGMSVNQFRNTLYTIAARKSAEWGLTLPEASERLMATNNALRFYYAWDKDDAVTVDPLEAIRKLNAMQGVDK
jgi:hypothetical protein